MLSSPTAFPNPGTPPLHTGTVCLYSNAADDDLIFDWADPVRILSQPWSAQHNGRSTEFIRVDLLSACGACAPKAVETRYLIDCTPLTAAENVELILMRDGIRKDCPERRWRLERRASNARNLERALATVAAMLGSCPTVRADNRELLPC